MVVHYLVHTVGYTAAARQGSTPAMQKPSVHPWHLLAPMPGPGTIRADLLRRSRYPSATCARCAVSEDQSHQETARPRALGTRGCRRGTAPGQESIASTPARLWQPTR